MSNRRRIYRQTKPSSIGIASNSSSVATGKSAERVFEPLVVSNGGKVVVLARLRPERREQLDGAPQMLEGGVARLAREGGEARVVVVQARVIGVRGEALLDSLQGIRVAVLAVGRQRLSVERPGGAPVNRLVRLAR